MSKWFHLWCLNGEYRGVCKDTKWDVSEGGPFVHQEVEVPEFPGVPEPELEDGIYRVMDGGVGHVWMKWGVSWYSLSGEFMGSVGDKRAEGLEVLSRLVEEEVK